MQTPSVGRIVLVPTDPAKNNGAEVAPAVITRVWSDVCVNLRVLSDNDAPPEWRTSVTHVDSVDDFETGQFHWTWPPRV